MHVLLTRPLEDSIDLIKRFKDKDITVSHLPLIKINKLDYPKLKSSEYNVIVFTSSNAIRNLDTKDFNKKSLCFCVGDATEKTAKQKGFYNTFSAGGNVKNLQELILQNLEKKTEKILYVSGELVSYDLDKDLKLSGFKIKKIINYTSRKITNLNSESLDLIKKYPPDITLIYSKRSAESFDEIARKYSLSELMTQCTVMCISKKIEEFLKSKGWKKTETFNPGEELLKIEQIKNG